MPDDYFEYTYLKPKMTIRSKIEKIVDDSDILDDSDSCLDDSHDN